MLVVWTRPTEKSSLINERHVRLTRTQNRPPRSEVDHEVLPRPEIDIGDPP
jgi:hypothetical protein